LEVLSKETPLMHRAARQITASIRILINTILSQAPKNRLGGRHLLANPDIKSLISDVSIQSQACHRVQHPRLTLLPKQNFQCT